MKWVDRFTETDRKKIASAAKGSLKKPEGRKALNYLKNKRKLSVEVIDKFDIGYCPPNIEHQVKGRIITPIYDIYGEIVAISTRHPDKTVKNRFWHESFDKGSYLYGLPYAKDAIQKFNKVIVVEGEMDVAAFHSAGFTMTVGVCGSVLTLFQVALLSRFCSDFYLMFDGDEAGRRAMRNSMTMHREYSLELYGLNFIPVHLPDKEDPDSFLLKNGRVEVRKKLIEAKENRSEEFII